MTNPAIEKLTNFTAEERSLAERLLRPQGSALSPMLDTDQFLGYLAQLNAAREAGQPVTCRTLKAAGFDVVNEPSAVHLRVAV